MFFSLFWVSRVSLFVGLMILFFQWARIYKRLGPFLVCVHWDKLFNHKRKWKRGFLVSFLEFFFFFCYQGSSDLTLTSQL